MALYIKTDFDNELRRLNTNIAQFSRKDELIDAESFPVFKDIGEFGVFNSKIHPNEIKKWWQELSDETKQKEYFIVWENGWISIPGKNVLHFELDK